MNVETIRDAQRARPFQPFTIRLADGRSFHVPHPDFMWLAPKGRTLVVAERPETPSDHYPMSILDVALIAEIRIDPAVGAR